MVRGYPVCTRDNISVRKTMSIRSQQMPLTSAIIPMLSYGESRKQALASIVGWTGGHTRDTSSSVGYAPDGREVAFKRPASQEASQIVASC